MSKETELINEIRIRYNCRRRALDTFVKRDFPDIDYQEIKQNFNSKESLESI